jgi:hypothetical protein
LKRLGKCFHLLQHVYKHLLYVRGH